MRRLLLVAAATALPALASAQTFPPAGQLRTVDFEPLIGSLVGTAQCKGEAGLAVTWQMEAATTGTPIVTGMGTVKIFASNKPRNVTGDPRACWLDTDNITDDTIKSVEIAKFNDIVMAQQTSRTIPGSGFAALATEFGLNCDSTPATPIYLCALPYLNSTSTTPLNGVADGTFSLDTTKPGQVSSVTVRSAEEALIVSFSEPTTGADARHFRAEAVRSDNTDPTVHSGTGDSSPVRIGGLTNEVEYTVRVIAISAAGNEGEPFPAPDDPQQVKGTPHPAEDFWDWYKRAGGLEQGGCATGAAGALAMLGAAALLRLRRRKP